MGGDNGDRSQQDLNANEGAFADSPDRDNMLSGGGEGKIGMDDQAYDEEGEGMDDEGGDDDDREMEPMEGEGMEDQDDGEEGMDDPGMADDDNAAMVNDLQGGQMDYEQMD